MILGTFPLTASIPCKSYRFIRISVVPFYSHMCLIYLMHHRNQPLSYIREYSMFFPAFCNDKQYYNEWVGTYAFFIMTRQWALMAWRQHKGDKAVYYERDKQGFIGSSAPEQMGANSHRRNRQIDGQLASKREQQVFIDFFFFSGGDWSLVIVCWSQARFQKMFSSLYTGIQALRFAT